VITANEVRLRAAAGIALLAALMATVAAAQTPASQNGSTHGRKTVRAVATENPIAVDGVLDEPIWKQAPAASGFIQKDPAEGQPASEKTEFHVVYTPTVLYIGVICSDSSPQGVLGNERKRDDDLSNDDSVTLVLDTFHDHRNAYMFRTNPLGTQYDALITDEGNNVNENWDEKWNVAAHITPTGWVAEFAIPFKTVRVPESDDGMVWGLDVERQIRRKNEDTYWTSYHRGFKLESMSQSGHLTGLEGIETGLRLRIKPYVLTGFKHTSDQAKSHSCPDATLAVGAPPKSAFCDASNAGIEVMKYRITPSLTADMTYRTDFAQTEVDNQQINLDRFPLFFPEKREFFQEGAGIFEFGTAENENGQAVTKLFHSRQIGLSPNREPIPIVAGGRITGKLQGFSVGMINVQTEYYAPENIPAGNYTVARVKRDILKRSTVGAFFLNHELGNSSDFNRVAGFDSNFVFFEHFSIGGYAGRAYTPGITKDTWSTAAVVRWNSDEFNSEISWHSVDRSFRDDLGFIPRPDQHLIAPQIAYRPRINGNLIRQLVFRGRMDYTMNQKNVLQTRIWHTAFEINFQDGGNFGFVPHMRFDTFDKPFNLRKGVVAIPAGSHSWWNSGLRYSGSPRRRISGQFINWAWHIGYYGGGTLHDINFNPRVRLTTQLSLQMQYGINKATFPARFCVNPVNGGCGFTDHLVNARVNYNFNNQWLTSTIIQYNNADHFWGLNMRLNYIFRPGDDFFLIYNEGRRFKDAAGVPYGPNERTIQAKMTYSFDF
jgi:uncharacterized protein DUF5916/cellulose/xylan binding protein with CBM9 domain